MSDDKFREDLHIKLNEAEKQLEKRELLDGEKVFKKLNEKYASDIEV